MYLASWAVLVQFMMCLVMPMFTGKKFTPDSLDGSTKTTDDDINAMPGGKFGAVTVTRAVFMTPGEERGRLWVSPNFERLVLGCIEAHLLFCI